MDFSLNVSPVRPPATSPVFDPLSSMRGSKAILTNLLARENITLFYDNSAQTASFDTVQRVLRIPTWQGLDNSTVDFLIGHEVGHALFTPTPTDEFQQICDANPNFFGYVNIVEDARIERMMKLRYPGFRADFTHGYGKLLATDLFGNLPTNLKKLKLIDRINLYFKLGIHLDASIPAKSKFSADALFSIEEMIIIERIRTVSSFTDVLTIAKELFGTLKKKRSKTSNNGTPNPELTSKGKDGAESDEDSNDEGDNDGEGGAEMKTNADSSDETAQSDEGDGESDGDSGESDGDSDSNTDSNKSGSGSAVRFDTQDMFNDAAQKMVESAKVDAPYRYRCDSENFEVPDTDSNLHIFGVRKFIAGYEKWFNHPRAWSGMAQFETNKHNFEEQFATTTKGIDQIVNRMMFDFNRKKAANSDRRTSITPTGLLDLGSLHTYKWNENIFLRNEVVADGKSHGIVLLLDWSTSFSEEVRDAVRQIIILTRFCRAVGIPFDVFIFTNGMHHSNYNNLHQHDEDCQQHRRRNIFDKGSKFSLVQLTSSSVPVRDQVLCEKLMWHMVVAATRSPYRHRGRARAPQNKDLVVCNPCQAANLDANWSGCLQLCGTPLHEGMIVVSGYIATWAKQNAIDIPSLIIITDGSGSSLLGGVQDTIYDKRNGKSIVFTAEQDITVQKVRAEFGNLVDIGSEYNVWCNLLRGRCPMNIIHFQIVTKASIRTTIRAFSRERPDRDGVSSKSTLAVLNILADGNPVSRHNVGGFNDVIVIPTSNIAYDEDDFMDTSEAVLMTPAKAMKEFTKCNVGKRSGMMIAEKIIDSIVRLDA